MISRPSAPGHVSRLLVTTCGIVALGALLLPGAGCASRRGAGRKAAVPRESGCPDAAPPRYRALERDGVQGGEILFGARGEPRDVLEMILDFDHDAANRPWRTGMKLVSRKGNRLLAEATYEGGAGFEPTVTLVYEVEPKGKGYLVRFFTESPAFGLQEFSGEYEIHPRRGGSSEVRELVYIDSGLPFVNASAEEIQAALHEDASQMQRWMARRLRARLGKV